MSRSTFARAAVAVGILASTVSAAFDNSSKKNVAMYWGQGSGQAPLSELCANPNVDIVNIAFVNEFPKQRGDYPKTNHGNACWGFYPDPVTGIEPLLAGLSMHCAGIEQAITDCQAAGKKVMLSLGGGVPTDYYLPDQDTAEWFAEFLIGAYGPVTDDWTARNQPRPFGAAVVDGFDLDLEADPTLVPSSDYIFKNYDIFGQYVKAHSNMLLSGAPQCIVPDARISPALKAVPFDFLFVQFYNTPACSARLGYTEGNTAKPGFTFNAWADWLLLNSAKKDIKLYLGLPAGVAGAGKDYPDHYLKPDEANTLISRYQKNAMFGGVMLWEATVSANNNQNYCKAYDYWIKSALEGSFSRQYKPSACATSSSIVLSSTKMSSSTKVSSSTIVSSSTMISSSKITSSTLISSTKVSSSKIASSTPVSSSKVISSTKVSSSAYVTSTAQSSSIYQVSSKVSSSTLISSTKVSSSKIASSTPASSSKIASSTPVSSSEVLSSTKVSSSAYVTATAQSSSIYQASSKVSSSSSVHVSSSIYAASSVVVSSSVYAASSSAGVSSSVYAASSAVVSSSVHAASSSAVVSSSAHAVSSSAVVFSSNYAASSLVVSSPAHATSSSAVVSSSVYAASSAVVSSSIYAASSPAVVSSSVLAASSSAAVSSSAYSVHASSSAPYSVASSSAYDISSSLYIPHPSESSSYGYPASTPSVVYPDNYPTGVSYSQVSSSAASSVAYSASSSDVHPTGYYPDVSKSTPEAASSAPCTTSSKVYPAQSSPSVYSVKPVESSQYGQYPAPPAESSKGGDYGVYPLSSSQGAYYAASSTGKGYDNIPSVTKGAEYPSKPTDATTTVVTTTYVDVCPTGLTTLTTTIIKTVCNSCAKPTKEAEVPEGWTTSVYISKTLTVTITKPVHPATDVPAYPSSLVYGASYPGSPKPSSSSSGKPEAPVYEENYPEKPSKPEYSAVPATSKAPVVPSYPEASNIPEYPQKPVEEVKTTSTVIQHITLTKVPVPYTPAPYPSAPYAPVPAKNGTSAYVPLPTGTGKPTKPSSYSPPEFEGAASRFGVGLTAVVGVVAAFLVL